MPAKTLVKELSEQEILRIARARVTETAANTFTQVELDTSLSIERGVIWMIQWIEAYYINPLRLAEVGPNLYEQTRAQIARETQTGILDGNDADLIQMFEWGVARSAAIGTDAGPLSFLINPITRVEYRVPIPYAAGSIFLGLRTTHSSLTSTVDFRIGYTLREVSDKYFFRVAQALLG